MSDSRGRGGRGGSRGDGGRGRGDGGRGRGGDRGGARGGARGGRGGGPDDGANRGSGRGTFRGGRGDRGGFDRGRGGRGRGRGRGDSFMPTGPHTSKHGRAELDQDIMKQEDDALKRLHSGDDLSKQVGKLSLKPATNESFPVRPAFGSKGTPVKLWANYFVLKVSASVMWKYTLEVNERRKDGELQQAKGRKLHLAVQQVLKYFGDSVLVATEFKSQLITREKLSLEQNPIQVEVPLDGNPDSADSFQVTIHGPSEIRLEDMQRYLREQRLLPDDHVFPRYQECLDALNVVLGHTSRAALDRITAVGGTGRYFPFGDDLRDEVTLRQYYGPRPLSALKGFFQSVRPATGQILLNANVTCGVFRRSGTVSVLFQDLGITGPARRDDYRLKNHILNVSKVLRKTRVWVRMKFSNGKVVKKSKAIYDLATPFTISRKGDNPTKFEDGIFFAGPKNVSFFLKEGEKPGRYISVAQHYMKKYAMDVGNYPVLNLGTKDKPTLFPAEMVEIQPGQPVKTKLEADETSQMLEHACQSPSVNAARIETQAREVLGWGNIMMGKYGISVDKKLLVVQGRKLTTPAVLYMNPQNKPKTVQVAQGSWNYRDCKVHKGANIGNWAIIQIKLSPNATEVHEENLQEFSQFMTQAGLSAGQRVHLQRPIFTKQDVEGNRLEDTFEWAKKNSIKFILVIFSARAESSLYSRVKVLGDCQYGIHTSCIVAPKMARGGSSYAANIVLKLNLKAGGTNHVLTQDIKLLKAGKTMVVGYDVTHPTNLPSSGKGSGPPSIVGIVGSVGSDLAQWPSTVWEQPARMEMLDDRLVDAFKRHLDLWRKANKGQLPANIILFRDGVSEGQFAQVLDMELPKIRDACDQYYGSKNKPRLTLVVSVKRHQTRFYPAEEGRTEGRTGNIEAGTVVDRGVTQARYWDFFLTAHHALKGTARPAHYTVLLDEIFRAEYKEKAADELEKLTYEMCHLFGRATKAISICPPAYYADIVCERARAHRPEMFEVSDTESNVTGQSGGGGTIGSTVKVHPDLADSMYYI